MIGTCRARHGLMQQRRALRVLAFGLAPAASSTLSASTRVAVRGLAERRRDQPIEARAGGKRRAAAADRSPSSPASCRRWRCHGRRRRAASRPSFFTSAGLHSTLRALGDHQLQRFDVGRDRGAEERRRVDARRRSTASCECSWPTNGLFGSAPSIEQQLDQVERASACWRDRRAAAIRRAHACRWWRRACRRRSRARRRSHRRRGRAASSPGRTGR